MLWREERQTYQPSDSDERMTPEEYEEWMESMRDEMNTPPIPAVHDPLPVTDSECPW